MPVTKKNTTRKSQKKAAPQVVVVIKTVHFGKDILFDKKLKEANEMLSKTTSLDGSPYKKGTKYILDACCKEKYNP